MLPCVSDSGTRDSSYILLIGAQEFGKVTRAAAQYEHLFNVDLGVITRKAGCHLPDYSWGYPTREGEKQDLNQ